MFSLSFVPFYRGTILKCLNIFLPTKTLFSYSGLLCYNMSLIFPKLLGSLLAVFRLRQTWCDNDFKEELKNFTRKLICLLSFEQTEGKILFLRLISLRPLKRMKTNDNLLSKCITYVSLSPLPPTSLPKHSTVSTCPA